MHLSIINIILTSLLSAAGVSLAAAQHTCDYPAVFGKAWLAAEQYAAGQREVWDEIFPVFDISTELATAVVFPELIRYSALQNFMETTAVKALYQQKGTKGADFSIGRFQMKPSFAENVEREWMKTPWRHEYGIYFDLSDNADARRARIRRLDSQQGQCLYLAMFLKLLRRRFPQLDEETTQQQVRLCAAAYNAPATYDYADLEPISRQKFFHTDFIKRAETTCYCYGDIAVASYISGRSTSTRVKDLGSL